MKLTPEITGIAASRIGDYSFGIKGETIRDGYVYVGRVQVDGVDIPAYFMPNFENNTVHITIGHAMMYYWEEKDAI